MKPVTRNPCSQCRVTMLRDIAILWDVMEFQDGRRGQTDGPRAKGIQFRLLIAFYALVLVLLHLYPRYRFGNTSISKRRDARHDVRSTFRSLLPIPAPLVSNANQLIFQKRDARSPAIFAFCPNNPRAISLETRESYRSINI